MPILLLFEDLSFITFSKIIIVIFILFSCGLLITFFKSLICLIFKRGKKNEK